MDKQTKSNTNPGRLAVVPGAQKLKDEDTYRLAAIVQSSTDAIIGKTLDGIITNWNPAAEKMYGYTAEEVIGKHISILAVPGGEKEFRDIQAIVNRGRSISRLQTKRRTKDGRDIDVSISAYPVRDQNDRVIGVSTIARDITEQIATERQLLQAQKMDAVGQLAAGIAHDFNNVITVIKAYSYLLKEYSHHPQQILRYAELTSQALDRAARVTSQLLAFSRKQPQQLQTVALNDIVSGLREFLSHALSENIELIVTLRSTGNVRVDTGQIEQVLMNLVINARDAMPTGGKLIVETTDVTLTEAYARAHGADIPPGNYQVLAVTDTGVGMDEITKTKIFEPFFTTKRGGQSSGLGLATVYGIAKQHQGYIWVYSESGKGTSMKLYLPQAAEASDAVVQRRVSQVAAPVGHETVLLVEDQKPLREIMQEYLRSLGYEVLAAEDGISAVHLLRSLGKNVDVLVTDMIMPGTRGAEVAYFGRQRYPRLKVIFMSGYGDMATRKQEAMNTAFLEKPFDLPTLARTIRELLDQDVL